MIKIVGIGQCSECSMDCNSSPDTDRPADLSRRCRATRNEWSLSITATIFSLLSNRRFTSRCVRRSSSESSVASIAGGHGVISRFVRKAPGKNKPPRAVPLPAAKSILLPRVNPLYGSTLATTRSEREPDAHGSVHLLRSSPGSWTNLHRKSRRRHCEIHIGRGTVAMFRSFLIAHCGPKENGGRKADGD